MYYMDYRPVFCIKHEMRLVATAPSLYRHYKGGWYEVIDTVRWSPVRSLTQCVSAASLGTLSPGSQMPVVLSVPNRVSRP